MRIGRCGRLGHLGLEYVQRTRRAAPRNCVDQKDAVVTGEQFVRQVQAPNAVVFDRHAGDRLGGERTRDLRPEAVVTEEDVADAGHQQPHVIRS